MILHTEPDFIRKSTITGIMSEDTKLDIYIKKDYLTTHLNNLKEFQKGLKMGSAVEKLEHGRPCGKTTGQNKRLNSRSWAILISELSLMEFEINRLNLLYNA